MKTKIIKLYEYSELKPKAQKKALNDWNENSIEEYVLQVDLDNYLSDLMEDNKIKRAGSDYPKIWYSLGYSQGDGAMFEGTFQWKGYTINVKQSGHYYHAYSKDIEMTTDKKAGVSIQTSKKFEDVYIKICKALERRGYEIIEDMQSEAYFIEQCNANEYTFREDGTMENE